MNAWIAHVKAYAAENKISYTLALKEASKTYTKKTNKKPEPKKEEPKKENLNKMKINLSKMKKEDLIKYYELIDPNHRTPFPLSSASKKSLIKYIQDRRKELKEPKKEPETKEQAERRKMTAEETLSQKIERVKKEEAEKEKPKKLAKIEEFINDTENYLNKKSTRAFDALMKKYNDKDFIKSILTAQKFSDFYPTSQKCLSNYNKYIKYIDENDIILEPTAGLGSIVLWLLKNNVKNKIIATDYNADINKYLKQSFDGINQVTVLDHTKSDYLDIKNNHYKYNPSIIFLNPPFSNGNDKKYYLNFLYKALYDLDLSEAPGIERQLFFISLQLTNKDEKDNQLINFDNVVISAKKKKEIKNMLNIDDDKWEELSPDQVLKVKTCDDFGGTNVKAVLYHMYIFA